MNDDYYDPVEEFDEYWHDPRNYIEHTCQGCGNTFKGHKDRGTLGFCDSCADKIERGEDVYY